MVDDEKPFPCSSPGCSMRFANEDHLSMHKKRHMSLSIDSSGSKTPTFVADETPTPTRFIRNCEEVGLFQELNPFDEQFRRAAEVTTLTSPTNPTPDDALHTPHVFPVVHEPDMSQSVIQLPPPKPVHTRRNYLMPSLSTSECLQLPSPLPTPVPTSAVIVTALSESSNSLLNKQSDKRPIKPTRRVSSPSNTSTSTKRGRKSSTSSLSGAKTTAAAPTAVNIKPRPTPIGIPTDPLTALLVRLPDGRLVQIPAIPLPTEAEAACATSATNVQQNTLLPLNNSPSDPLNTQQSKPVLSETKMKLKQALTKTRAANHHSPSNVASPSIPSDASGTDTEQGVAMNDSTTEADAPHPPHRPRNYNSASDIELEDEESEKRRRFLERNRAAAFRSRQKRKHWVSSLEAKTAAMNAANRVLQNEVVALRSEVAQLKLQLLAHKDCPVTLALCQQSTPSNHQTVPTRPVPSHQSTVGGASAHPPRQIIILNTAAQSPPGVPNVAKKSSDLERAPIVLVPTTSPSSSVTKHSPSFVARAMPDAKGQQPTSVIMTVKMSEK